MAGAASSMHDYDGALQDIAQRTSSASPARRDAEYLRGAHRRSASGHSAEARMELTRGLGH
jgi:hypothetical protein